MRHRPWKIAAACCAALPLALAACETQKQRDLKHEGARLGVLVDAVREAPNNAKGPPLRALRTAKCKHPLACELQTICVQGYELHVRSIEASTRVRAQLASNKQLNAQAATAVLDMNERDLKRARRLMQGCIDRQGEIARQ